MWLGWTARVRRWSVSSHATKGSDSRVSLGFACGTYSVAGSSLSQIALMDGVRVAQS